MCGICGLINYDGDAKEAVHKMNDLMIDRGPDAEGIWQSDDGTITFGHRRLSIRDLSPNGSQPMLSKSGKMVIAFNGEIYNATVLKDKLISDGYMTESDFRGTSDTEVLLESIEHFGIEDALDMAKGMFAIAVYDKEKSTVSLARDRVGEKPLYYGFIGEKTFFFTSNIYTVKAINNFKNKINKDVLPLYFSHGYIPAPYSIYKDVYKLMPGTILTLKLPVKYFNPVTGGDVEWFYNADKKGDVIRGKNHKFTIYWSMKEAALNGAKNPFKGSFEEATDKLEELLTASIRDQQASDVPLGAFLSAGIDSSTIVALMQKVTGGKTRTFTIGMNVEGYNEAEIAKEIAKILKTDHTEMYIDENDAKAVIPKLSAMFGEPFADSSQIPTYLVSKMTKEHVTVSLSGDAGDELFCGYTSYRSIERIWGKMKSMPYPIRKLAGDIVLKTPMAKKDIVKIKAGLLKAKNPANLHMIEQDPWRYGEKLTGISNDKLNYAGNSLNKYLYKENGEVNHEVMLMDMMMYHPDDILVKVDRTAMAVSLESRVPMLDKDVIEFAWTLPIEYLRDEKTGKNVLRNVLYRYVPKELMDRPKKGFSIPIDKWLLEDEKLKSWAKDLLDKKTIKEQGILDVDLVESIWNEFENGGEFKVQIWYILMFQQWMRDVYQVRDNSI